MRASTNFILLYSLKLSMNVKSNRKRMWKSKHFNLKHQLHGHLLLVAKEWWGVALSSCVRSIFPQTEALAPVVSSSSPASSRLLLGSWSPAGRCSKARHPSPPVGEVPIPEERGREMCKGVRREEFHTTLQASNSFYFMRRKLSSSVFFFFF